MQCPEVAVPVEHLTFYYQNYYKKAAASHGNFSKWSGESRLRC